MMTGDSRVENGENYAKHNRVGGEIWVLQITNFRVYNISAVLNKNQCTKKHYKTFGNFKIVFSEIVYHPKNLFYIPNHSSKRMPNCSFQKALSIMCPSSTRSRASLNRHNIVARIYFRKLLLRFFL